MQDTWASGESGALEASHLASSRCKVTLSNLQNKTWEISKILRDFREETIYLYTSTFIGILHKVLDAQAFLGGLQSLQWLAHCSVSFFRYDSTDVSTAFFKLCTSASRAIRYVHIYILSFDELTMVATHAFAKAHAARAKTVLFYDGFVSTPALRNILAISSGVILGLSRP